MTIALWLLASLALFIALAYVNASGVAWAVAAAVLIGVSWTASLLPPWLNLALAVVFVVQADSFRLLDDLWHDKDLRSALATDAAQVVDADLEGQGR